MLYAFHTYTSLSDGVLSPMELIRHALARLHWDILAIPGIELTLVPTQAIAETAKEAKQLGACIVVVHGETIIEPVEKGTNPAPFHSPHVDILTHLAQQARAKLRLSSDAYSEQDLLTTPLADSIMRSTELDTTTCHQVLTANPPGTTQTLTFQIVTAAI